MSAQNNSGTNQSMNVKKQYGFYIDSSKCTGCKTCQLSCKDNKDLSRQIQTLYWKPQSFDHSPSDHLRNALFG